MTNNLTITACILWVFFIDSYHCARNQSGFWVIFIYLVFLDHDIIHHYYIVTSNLQGRVTRTRHFTQVYSQNLLVLTIKFIDLVSSEF